MNNPTDTSAWEKIMNIINTDSRFSSSHRGFLRLVTPLGVVNNLLMLCVPTDHARDYFHSQLDKSLKPLLEKVLGVGASYEIFVDPNVGSNTTSSSLPNNENQIESQPIVVSSNNDFSSSKNETILETNELSETNSLFENDSSSRDLKQNFESAHLNPRFTFDTFVIGQSNRFAHAAAIAVSENPGRSYNPLFIYGGSGLGKTHLLHAIGNYAHVLDPNLKVLYINTEEFVNDFINSLTSNMLPKFKNRYRSVDILLIDDIQFLSGKEQTLVEFFHTFNALHSLGKQIVITSDLPPDNLADFTDRLRSRFQSGLITDVTAPDLETRTAILRKKAQAEDIEVPDNVLSYIADHISTNIRELEGALLRVTAYAALTRQNASLSLAEQVLKDIITGDNAEEITPSSIMNKTANYFDLTVEQLCSAERSQEISNARQVAMYLCRELTDLSLPRIGQLFGNRDHSTVLYANRKILERMSENPTLFNQIQELTNLIKRANHNN